MLRQIDLSKGEPVRLFNSLLMESGAVCNRTCVFCPNHGRTRSDDWLPWPLIEKIVDELSALRWKGRFTTFQYNEPLRDDRFFEICELVTTQVPGACIHVSTNGDYFRCPDDIDAVLRAGVRQLMINVYSEWDLDPARRAHGITVAENRLKTLQGWVDSLVDIDQKASLYMYARRGERRVKVYKKFGSTPADKAIGEHELQNRSGLISHMKPALAEPLSKGCVRPWRTMQLNWKGELVLCCNDFYGTTEMGNISDHTLVELWNSDAMNKYRLFLQNKRRDLPLCETCDYSGGKYTHMISPVTFGSVKDQQLLA